MKILLNERIKNVLLLCFLIITFTNTSFSQEKKSILDIEKTYIHTDRSSYVIGESLWYKAYTVYAYNNMLFNYSNILYVELISENSKIITRNKTKLLGGLGHGDIKLTDSLGIRPGKYQLRAYTNWTRNFGEDFVFKKDIEILDVFNEVRKINSSSSKTTLKNGTNTTLQANNRPIKLNFFPEGGSLVENVSSTLAFKAVDSKGNPVKVQGKVYDSNNELVTFFMSSHDGMGKFQLKPEKGKKYYAKVTPPNNKEIEVSIPKVKSQGLLLGYKEIRGRAILSIQTNQETLAQHSEKPLTIQYRSKGLLYFEEKLSLTNSPKLLLELPKEKLAEGIIQITLLDANSRPHSERLVYVQKNQDLIVDLSANKTLYEPNEKVIVSVSSKNNLGEAVSASYSMTSVDLNGAKAPNDNAMNISSYFLMESDIRGRVHNPGYYFDSSNPLRFQHLDLLLLTQGWRDFLWKEERTLADNPYYKVEKGINISGKVKSLFGSKPIEGNVISLMLFNKIIGNLNNEITDSEGRFMFEDLDIIGKARITLITKNKRGKKTGMFVLDSIFKSPMKANYTPPSVNTILSSEKDLIAKNIYNKHVGFNVIPENVLGAVEISGRGRNSIPSFYGKLEHSYEINEKTSGYADIYQLIVSTIPNTTVEDQTIRFIRNQAPALLVINGKVTDVETDLDFILPEDVVKLEAANGPTATMIFGNRGGNGAIIIYTKSSVDFGSPKGKLQTIKEQIEGYYEARIFYSPDLSIESEEKDKNAAIRNTLYWNPYIHPDKTTGEATVNYYNTEVETNVSLTIEGLTATGIPVVKKTTYSIEE